MKKTISAIFAVAALTISAIASDLTMTFSVEQKRRPASKGKQHIEQNFQTARFSRTNNGSTRIDLLTDHTNSVAYQINHKKKTIQKIYRDDTKAQIELIRAGIEDGYLSDAAFVRAINRIFGNITEADIVLVRDGTETVANVEHERWKLSVGKVIYHIIADPSISRPRPIDGGGLIALLGMSPRTEGIFNKFAAEFLKIEGVPLRMEVHIMGRTVTYEVISIDDSPIPESVFELPSSYQVEDVGKIRLQRLEAAVEKRKQRNQKKQKR